MVEDLVSELRAHLGDEKAQKFLADLNGICRTKKRLLWWQERAWDSFTKSHPEYSDFFYEDVRELLLFCEIHYQPLHPDTVTAVYGYWGLPRDYIDARINHFPHANLMYMGDSVEKDRWKNREVLYCEACRNALKKWNEGRPHPIGMPKTETTNKRMESNG